MHFTSVLGRVVPARWQTTTRYWRHRIANSLEPEMEWFLSRIPRNRTFVDVGANYGIYTHAARRHGLTVDAFEPFPACVAALQSYAKRDSGVRIHQTALGAARGTATLRVPYTSLRPIPAWGSLKQRDFPIPVEDVPVTVRTLDSFGLLNVGGIKIDVEGSEFDVLAGAERTIRTYRPLLLIELNPAFLGGAIEDAFQRIEAMGYRGEFLADLGDEYEPSPVAMYHAGLKTMNFLWVPTHA